MIHHKGHLQTAFHILFGLTYLMSILKPYICVLFLRSFFSYYDVKWIFKNLGEICNISPIRKKLIDI